MEKSLDSHLDDMSVPYCSFLLHYTKIIGICVLTPSVFFPTRMSEHGVIGVLCSDQQGLALSGL